MKRFEAHGRLGRLTEPERCRIRSALASSSRITLSHQSVASDVDPASLLAALLTCADDGLCQLVLRVYHVCEPHPILTCRYSEGLPTLPISCPECEGIISDPAALSFDIESIADEPIEYIE